MAKKQGTKQRTRVKDLPKKEKKLSTGDMEKIKGGLAVDPSDPSGNTVYVGGASGGVWKTTNAKPESK